MGCLTSNYICDPPSFKRRFQETVLGFLGVALSERARWAPGITAGAFLRRRVVGWTTLESVRVAPLPRRLGVGPPETRREPSLGRCRGVTPMCRKQGVSHPSCFENWRGKIASLLGMNSFKSKGSVFLGQWGSASIWDVAGHENWRNCNFGDPLVEVSPEGVGRSAGKICGRCWQRSGSTQSVYWEQLSKATPCGNKKQQQQRLR